MTQATCPGVRALQSTPCGGERHGVVRIEENGDGNGKGDRNRKGQLAWSEREHEQRKGEADASGAGSGGGRVKTCTLVGYVPE